MNSKMLSRLLAVFILMGIVYYFLQGKSANDTNVAYVQSLIGDVSKIHELTSKSEKLKPGDKLVSNEIIQTAASSSVLIVLGNGYQLKIRIGENSSFKLSELMKSGIDGRELSAFNLIRGQILALLNNKNNKAEIKIRTRHMAMGIRGTLLSVMSDGVNRTFLGVKHGEVSSTNLITNKENIVSTENVLFTNEDGKENLGLNKSLIEKINWDVDAENNIGVDTKIILNAESSDTNGGTGMNKYTTLISNAEKHIEEHQNELNKNLHRINDLMDVVKARTQAANKDIECLSKYTERCKLITENELLHRGFPIEYGNKKYINLIIDELNKYKDEPLKEINELKLANQELSKTIENKQKIISDAKAILLDSQSSEQAKNDIIKKISEEI